MILKTEIINKYLLILSSNQKEGVCLTICKIIDMPEPSITQNTSNVEIYGDFGNKIMRVTNSPTTSVTVEAKCSEIEVHFLKDSNEYNVYRECFLNMDD